MKESRFTQSQIVAIPDSRSITLPISGITSFRTYLRVVS